MGRGSVPAGMRAAGGALVLVAVALATACLPAPPAAGPDTGEAAGIGRWGRALLGAEVDVLEDPSARLTFDDVTREPHATQFQALSRPVLNPGYTHSAYWLRFRIGASTEPLLLEVANPTLTDVSVHRLGSNGRLTTTRTGQPLPLSTRERVHPALLFQVAPSSSTLVHVRVASRAPVRVPLRLWRPADFDTADRLAAITSGLFYGAMLLAAVFQLLLSIAVRDRTHPIFSGVIATTCVTLLGLDGLGSFYLWPSLAPWGTDLTTWAAVATIVGMLAFTSQFLALRDRSPRPRQALVVTACAMVACGVLVPRTAIYMTMAGTAVLVSLLSGVHAWWSGYAPARRFVMAWGLLTLGFVWGQLVLLGATAAAGLGADQIYRLAALPAVALVSVSLVDRFWLLRRTAETAEAALKRQEATLVEVARGIVGTTGDEVFSALVRQLARALEADHAFVGELDAAAQRVRTVSVWSDGKAGENFDYGLPDSPCADVLRTGTCLFPDEVQARFPRDAGLARMGIRAYAGTPLHDSAGKPIGLLVCLYRQPLADPASAERMLKLFAGRAASELERRRAERALAEREALLGALLDNSPALIYVKDPDGRYVLVNRQFEQHMRLSREMILGRGDADILPADVAAMLRRHDQQVLESATPLQFEEQGAGEFFLSTKAALRDHAGVPWAMIGVSTDITEFHKLQAQVRAAQRMEAFGQLAGGVAHDFNNLLTAILGYLELCERQVPEGSPVAADLAEAREATQRAARITSQLLAFARRQPSAPLAVELNGLVRGVGRLLRQAAGAAVAVHFDLHPGPVHVRLDPAQFEQVLLNLVINARDAMEGGGTVRVETGTAAVATAAPGAGAGLPAGRYAVLRVTDTGSGIAAEHLPRIFEPFFTTKPSGRGSGLGLSMCHGIVRQAGGAIDVESAEGHGTTFTVYLPEAAAQDAPRPAAPRHAPAGGAETVLVAEDEPSIRRFASRVLTGRGYHVLLAASGEEALALAAAHDGRIDLLLSDVAMPGINGRELADALRAARPGIRVVYMSGYGEQALADDGLVADGSPYLPKPFTMERLAATVREVLDARRPDGGRSAPTPGQA